MLNQIRVLVYLLRLVNIIRIEVYFIIILYLRTFSELRTLTITSNPSMAYLRK